MANLAYDVTVYVETVDLFPTSVIKSLFAQFDPIIDPTILRPGDSYRFSASS